MRASAITHASAFSTSSAPTTAHEEPTLEAKVLDQSKSASTTTSPTSCSNGRVTTANTSTTSFSSLLIKILLGASVVGMLSIFLLAFYNYYEYQQLLKQHHGDANSALFEFLAVKDFTKVGSLFFASTLRLLNLIENEAPQQLLPPQHRLLQMALLFQQSQALFECVEMAIPDIIHEQVPYNRIHVTDLAKRLQLSNVDYLQRYMKALESLGLFQEVSSHTFANNHLSSHLRSDHPQSMKDFIIHMHRMSKGWAQLGTVLKQGKPFFNNTDFWFHTIGDNHDERRIFMNSMKTLTFLGDDAIIVQKNGNKPSSSSSSADGSKPIYDFSTFESVIDVGGASGTFLAKILQSYPSVKGVLFDLPSVIEDAQEAWKQNHLDLMQRVTFARGDFFNQSTLPSQQDSNLFILRMILHDWNDQDCIRILRNIRYAMQHHESKLLIVESMLQEGQNKNKYIDKYQRLNDMHMLVFGGKERSATDMKKLLEASGFAVSRVIPTFSALTMIEAMPV